MQILVTFRHIEATDALKEYVEKKIKKIEKYLYNPIEAHIVLSVEKFRHSAEIKISANGVIINGKEIMDDMYSAIDRVIDKIDIQVRKYRKKIIKKHKSSGESKKTIDSKSELKKEISIEEDKPQIIRKKNIFIKPMSIDEAIMQINLLNNGFILFTNVDTGNPNVLYKRKDGNYGLIEMGTEHISK